MYLYLHITSSRTSILLDFVEYDSCTATHLKDFPWFSLEIVSSRTESANQVLGLSNSVVFVCLLIGVISSWSETTNGIRGYVIMFWLKTDNV